MRKKGYRVGWWGGESDLGRVQGKETMIKIYHMKKFNKIAYSSLLSSYIAMVIHVCRKKRDCFNVLR